MRTISSLGVIYSRYTYVGCQSREEIMTFCMICVYASVSFFFQFHTMTTEPKQPLTRRSGFLG